MASILKVDTITGVTTAGSIAVTGEGNSTTTNLQQGLAKAWVEGSNAAALTDSFAISGGTDNGTGDYSYALSSNMGSASYSISVCCHSGGLAATNDDSQSTSSYKAQIFSRTSTGSASDQVNYSSVHGDLA
jgi:hypothetical protein